MMVVAEEMDTMRITCSASVHPMDPECGTAPNNLVLCPGEIFTPDCVWAT